MKKRYCSTWHYGINFVVLILITMMTTWCMQTWDLDSLVVCYVVKTHNIHERNMTIRSDLDWEHPLPMVSGYKRRCEIEDVNITKFKMYLYLDSLNMWIGMWLSSHLFSIGWYTSELIEFILHFFDDGIFFWKINWKLWWKFEQYRITF
jgi:hypothetical protein